MQSKLSKVTLLILLLAFALTTLLLPMQAFAATTATTTPTGYTKASDVAYKKDGKIIYNWGVRGETATFLTTNATSYYTGSYTFDNLSELGSSQLLTNLRSLMSSNHKATSYNNCRDYAKYTDCQKNDGSVILLYTSYIASMSDYSASAPGWNREHVWPKSLGGFETSGPGADVHHIRPDDVTTNSNRGNKKYGNVTGGETSTGKLASGIVGGTYGGGYFEPLDNVKGDVARICLYVYARYGGDWGKCSSITNVFQSVDVLLDWMEKDPVDTWEMGRNDSCESIAGNRNVFIDYPEYAWLIFGKNVPEDYETPSHNSGVTAKPDQGGNSGGNTGNGSNTGNDGNQGTTTPVETVHVGTKADPYTVADALAVGNSLSSGSNSKKVYIKATVKSSGEKATSSSGSTYLKNVVVSDSSTTETLRAYTLNPNSAADLELKVGDTVLIYGYIRIYNGEIEIGSNLNDRTDYSYFSIVTDTTGGSGDIEITPDNAIEVFKTAVAEASNAATVNGKYSAIKTAVTAYNMLTAEQKQQVSTEFAMLKTAIESYNSAISKQNENSTNALKYSLQLVATTAVALAVVIFTKKVLFK